MNFVKIFCYSFHAICDNNNLRRYIRDPPMALCCSAMKRVGVTYATGSGGKRM